MWILRSLPTPWICRFQLKDKYFKFQWDTICCSLTNISESQWMFNPNSLEILTNDSAQWLDFHPPFENYFWPLTLRHTVMSPAYLLYLYLCLWHASRLPFQTLSPLQSLTLSLNCIWLSNFSLIYVYFKMSSSSHLIAFSFFEKHFFSCFNYYFLTPLHGFLKEPSLFFSLPNTLRKKPAWVWFVILNTRYKNHVIWNHRSVENPLSGVLVNEVGDKSIHKPGQRPFVGLCLGDTKIHHPNQTSMLLSLFNQQHLS